MSFWRRLPFITMALFALCALTMPSLVWACPMAARTGDAVALCQCPMARQGAAMPCCARADQTKKTDQTPKSCCKPVVELPGDTRATTLAAPADFSALLDQVAPVYLITLPLALRVAAPEIEPQLTTWHDAPPRLFPAQDAPAAWAGRAPPLVS